MVVVIGSKIVSPPGAVKLNTMLSKHSNMESSMIVTVAVPIIPPLGTTAKVSVVKSSNSVAAVSPAATASSVMARRDER